MAFFQGANIDPGANVLYDPMAARNAQQKYQQNALMMAGEQQRQAVTSQAMAEHEQQQIGQAAAWVAGLPQDQQEDAYNGAVQQLRANGMARNAPAYPGAQALRGIAQRTLPVEKQYELGLITSPELAAALKGAFGQGGMPGGTSGTAAPAAGAAAGPPGMAASESGGNPGVVNAQGYSGTYQMGKARMADLGYYKPADGEDMKSPDWQGKVSVPGFAVSNQADFLKNPAAQNAVYAAHMADIQKQVAATPGAAQMDPGGLAAVAHLGGVAGMQRFVSSGGLYDPADANGTKLSDYYRKFSGGAAPGGVAARTGGVNVAGPGAPTGPAPGFGPGGQQLAAGTWDASPVTAAPGGAAPAPAPSAPPGAPAAAPMPGGQAGQPAPATPATGINSPQYQQAAEKLRQAAQLEAIPGAAMNPQAKAAVAYLRQQAQMLLQADSVTYDANGIGHKAISGEQVSAAQPLSHFVWDPERGAYVDTSGAKAPVTPPSPRGTFVPGVGYVQSKPGGGADVLFPMNAAGLATQKAAEAQGSAAGANAGKSTDQLAQSAQTSGQAIGNIDYGVAQLDKAKAGGINTGYFSGALTTVQSALKSLGVPTDKVPFINVDPSAIGNIQTARKTLSVVSGAILQQILGKDSPITDSKIEAFIHAQPGIETDPDAVRRVLNWARSQFVYENEMSRAGLGAASGTGMVPLNFKAQYISQHGAAPIYDPMTGEMQQPDGRAPSREPPTSAAPLSVRTADDYAKVPAGGQYTAPDGSVRRKAR